MEFNEGYYSNNVDVHDFIQKNITSAEKGQTFLLCTSFAEACAIKTVSRNVVEFFRGRKQRGKI